MTSFDATGWRRAWLDLSLVLLIAAIACIVEFALSGHVGFNIRDEGYLWYGVQRVLLGEVPIRDFMSYDPGRYYWAGMFLWLFDERGIVAVRGATAAFGFLGIVCAAWLVLCEAGGSRTSRWIASAAAVVLCVLWMEPWWKAYDEALSLVLIVSLTRVLSRPVPARFLVHGVVVGLAAVFGRNHGLYGVVACLIATPILIVGLHSPVWRRCIPAWMAGVLIGFSPILLGMLADHSFAAKFWETIRFVLFEYKGTNLPLPVPWPWTIPDPRVLTLSFAAQWLMGALFVILPLFCVLGAVVILYCRWLDRRVADLHPGFVACIATAIPYLNVAFSRADVSHLAQAIFPLLLGVLIFPTRSVAGVSLRWICVASLLAVSLLVALPLHPWYEARIQAGWQVADVGGDKLLMSHGQATQIEAIKTLVDRYAASGGTIFAAPVWPGVYAMFGLKSPNWEIYPLFPRNEEFQYDEIARLQRAQPSLLLIYDIRVDSREDLRYMYTHALMWDYINKHYRKLPASEGFFDLQAYVPKSKQG